MSRYGIFTTLSYLIILSVARLQICFLLNIRDNTGKQCTRIAIRLPALLVEGIPQAPLNAEFYSAAARSANAYDQDQLTAGRSLFLVLFSVPHPFSAVDPHWPWQSKVPAFLHGSAGARYRFSSFPPAVWRTRLAAP